MKQIKILRSEYWQTFSDLEKAVNILLSEGWEIIKITRTHIAHNAASPSFLVFVLEKEQGRAETKK
jgi:hypothetical protein